MYIVVTYMNDISIYIMVSTFNTFFIVLSHITIFMIYSIDIINENYILYM